MTVRLALVSVLAAALLAAAPTAARGQSRECVLAFVVDGDTIHCENGEKVRLARIDVPDGGRFGAVARRALAALLRTGGRYRLEPEAGGPDADGRTHGFLFLADGRMVNEMMIRQGYAFLDPGPESAPHAARLRAAEAAARAERLGVWTR